MRDAYGLLNTGRELDRATLLDYNVRQSDTMSINEVLCIMTPRVP